MQFTTREDVKVVFIFETCCQRVKRAMLLGVFAVQRFPVVQCVEGKIVCSDVKEVFFILTHLFVCFWKQNSSQPVSDLSSAF